MSPSLRDFLTFLPPSEFLHETGTIYRRKMLGGLISDYYREAAQQGTIVCADEFLHGTGQIIPRGRIIIRYNVL